MAKDKQAQMAKGGAGSAKLARGQREIAAGLEKLRIKFTKLHDRQKRLRRQGRDRKHENLAFAHGQADRYVLTGDECNLYQILDRVGKHSAVFQRVRGGIEDSPDERPFSSIRSSEDSILISEVWESTPASFRIALFSLRAVYVSQICIISQEFSGIIPLPPQSLGRIKFIGDGTRDGLRPARAKVTELQ